MSATFDNTTQASGGGDGLTPEQQAKLDSIQHGATANSTDTHLLDRQNHTGTQAIETVEGLQAALDSKAAVVHGHAIGDVADLQSELDGKAAATHGHAIGDVTDLQTALDGKAATVHTHTVSDVTGLQTELDAKALDSAISVVGKTGEYNDLLNKPDLSALSGIVQVVDFANLPATGDNNTVYITQDTGYMYRWSGVSYVQLTDQTAIWGQVSGTLSNQTDLQTELDGKAAITHSHVISDVTGLQTALDAKADSVHTHTISDVTDLQTTLDGKAATTHNHDAADIVAGVFVADRLPSNAHGTRYISTEDPTGGVDGDIWLKII